MRILFFAQLKDVTGQAEVTWPDADGLTASAIWQRLAVAWPAVLLHRPATRLARNGEYVSDDAVLQTGDEIALIPPVSGG